MNMSWSDGLAYDEKNCLKECCVFSLITFLDKADNKHLLIHDGKIEIAQQCPNFFLSHLIYFSEYFLKEGIWVCMCGNNYAFVLFIFPKILHLLYQDI
jgi:hypothetical protein